MGIIRKVYDKGEKIVEEIKKKTSNPLREFEKELNNLKAYLKESENLVAHLNALKIRAEKDIDDYKIQVNEYAKKAEEAAEKSKNGEISEKTAETIALNALKFKKSYQKRTEELKNKIPLYEKEILSLKDKISDLRIKIKHYEEEYNFLKTFKTQKENIGDIFYGDNKIFSRLEKLKNNLIKQNEKNILTKTDDLYYNIPEDEILEEWNNLKNK